jgi:hypothetical protein
MAAARARVVCLALAWALLGAGCSFDRRMTGVVTDANDGSPVVGAGLFLDPERAEGDPTVGGSVFLSRTDSAGSFDVVLPSEAFETPADSLRVSVSGYTSATFLVTVLWDTYAQTKEVRLTLQPAEGGSEEWPVVNPAWGQRAR